MQRVILAVLCIAYATFASAGTATLSCTPPTQNTDGSPIVGAISYRFVWGTSATNLTNSVNSSTCSAVVTVPDPAPGTSVTYHFGVHAIVDGMESERSALVTKTLTTPKPTPNPPTSLRVIEPTAYRYDQGNKSKPLFVKVGAAPLGLECHTLATATDVYGKTFSLVKNRDAVTVTGTRPLNIFARCG